MLALSVDLADLDLLEAEPLDGVLMGDAGDDYLKAHPEIQRGSDGRPLRGMLLPVSEREKAEWKAKYGTPFTEGVAYQGPSYTELKQRGSAALNEAERFWVASIEGNLAEVEKLRREAELLYQTRSAQIDADLARSETDVERKRRELAEDSDDLFGLNKIKKAIPWVVGTVLLIGVGVPVFTSLTSLIPRRST